MLNLYVCMYSKLDVQRFCMDCTEFLDLAIFNHRILAEKGTRKRYAQLWELLKNSIFRYELILGKHIKNSLCLKRGMIATCMMS